MNIIYIIMATILLSLWTNQSSRIAEYNIIAAMIHCVFGSCAIAYVIYASLFLL